MDLGLTEEQEMLKNFARDFLENECPEKLVRDMEEDERGYTDGLWQGMANQGWQGLIIDDEHGGTGMSFLDLCVLLEEFVLKERMRTVRQADAEEERNGGRRRPRGIRERVLP